MNKIWIPLIIFALILCGGFFYNNFVLEKTEHMIMLTDMAYQEFVSGGESEKYLDKALDELEEISGFLCAFLDRDIINEAKDAIVYAKGLARSKNTECRAGIMMVKEKISHIKNTAEIKLKYIL